MPKRQSSQSKTSEAGLCRAAHLEPWSTPLAALDTKPAPRPSKRLSRADAESTSSETNGANRVPRTRAKYFHLRNLRCDPELGHKMRHCKSQMQILLNRVRTILSRAHLTGDEYPSWLAPT